MFSSQKREQSENNFINYIAIAKNECIITVTNRGKRNIYCKFMLNNGQLGRFPFEWENQKNFPFLKGTGQFYLN